MDIPAPAAPVPCEVYMYTLNFFYRFWTLSADCYCKISYNNKNTLYLKVKLNITSCIRAWPCKKEHEYQRLRKLTLKEN